jgi:hypothetical protein
MIKRNEQTEGGASEGAYGKTIDEQDGAPGVVGNELSGGGGRGR